ncbi:MAG: hypothetical protein AAF513_02535 [Pseudomonadota bacterium]
MATFAEFNIHTYPTPLAGCHQFAVSDTHALFTGQYDHDTSMGYVLKLREGEVAPQPVKLVFPNGAPLRDGVFVGCGAQLHFFDQRAWFAVCLR